MTRYEAHGDMQSNQTLTAGDISIRPFTAEDVENFFASVRASAESLSRWMPWCHLHYSIEEAKAWLATCQQAWSAGTSYPFLIIDPKTNAVMGSVDINQINREHNFGNIGYWVCTSCTGKGIATSAVKMVARFGFIELGLTRLEIVALTDNLASRRVAEKAGARFECLARNRLTGWGKSHDAAVYSLIPTDLAELPPLRSTPLPQQE